MSNSGARPKHDRLGDVWMLVAQLTVCVQLAACSDHASKGGSKPNGDDAGAAGAPSEGPTDTLFEADVLNEVEEGSYFLSGEDEGPVRVELLLSFQVAMHVAMTIEGGGVDDVMAWPASNEDALFYFDFPEVDRPEYDFSAGTYLVRFLAHGVDGAYRIHLDATALGGSQL